MIRRRKDFSNEEKPRPRTEPDLFDKNLLALLGLDPTLTIPDLAERLSVSVGKVKKRIKLLQEWHLLTYGWITAPNNPGLPILVLVHLKAKNTGSQLSSHSAEELMVELRKKANQPMYADKVLVCQTYEVFGSLDRVVIVGAADSALAQHFINEEVRVLSCANGGATVIILSCPSKTKEGG